MNLPRFSTSICSRIRTIHCLFFSQLLIFPKANGIRSMLWPSYGERISWFKLWISKLTNSLKVNLLVLGFQGLLAFGFFAKVAPLLATKFNKKILKDDIHCGGVIFRFFKNLGSNLYKEIEGLPLLFFFELFMKKFLFKLKKLLGID